MFDVDIDVPTNIDLAKLFPGVVFASRHQGTELLPHPCGTYFETMPIDPITNLAAIPYDEADKLGFTKIDFLSLSILNQFDNKDDVLRALEAPVDWSLLKRRDIVEQLFQLRNSWEFVEVVGPASTEELADLIALIRPTKRRLLSRYLANPTQTRPLLFKQDDSDVAAFRRAHAIAYAYIIIIQLSTFSTQTTISVDQIDWHCQLEL